MANNNDLSFVATIESVKFNRVPTDALKAYQRSNGLGFAKVMFTTDKGVVVEYYWTVPFGTTLSAKTVRELQNLCDIENGKGKSVPQVPHASAIVVQHAAVAKAKKKLDGRSKEARAIKAARNSGATATAAATESERVHINSLQNRISEKHIAERQARIENQRANPETERMNRIENMTLETAKQSGETANAIRTLTNLVASLVTSNKVTL